MPRSRSTTCRSSSAPRPGPFRAVDGVDADASRRARSLGVVGESGSGKSVAMLAVMGLLPGPRAHHRRAARLRRQRPAAAVGRRQRRRLIGKDMAMIFQEPMSSLNPCFTVGFQIGEALQVHEGSAAGRGGARRSSCWRRSASPPPRPARRLPAPALRRHEPAGDDRHGDRLQPEAADRRRADDRARRHHPGADPRPAARPAARARHGAGADHPRHGRGRRDRRAGRRACMPARRSRTARWPRLFADAAPSLHRGAARRPAGAALGRRRLPTIPGVVPGLLDRPTGCLFSPRCRFATDLCRSEPPRFAPTATAPCAATTRCGDGVAGHPEPGAHDGRLRRPPSLARHYGVGGGAVRAGRRRCRRCDGVSFTLDAGRTLAVVGEFGLRQVDAGAPGHPDRAADRRPARARRRRRRRRRTPATAAACAARCRSCSRTPTARSTRARRSARSSKSR